MSGLARLAITGQVPATNRPTRACIGDVPRLQATIAQPVRTEWSPCRQPALQRDVLATDSNGARGEVLLTASDVASGGVLGQNTTGCPSGSANRRLFMAVTGGGVDGASSSLATKSTSSSRAASTRRIKTSRRFGTSTLSKASSAFSASSTRARSTRTRSISTRVDRTNYTGNKHEF